MVKNMIYQGIFWGFVFIIMLNMAIMKNPVDAAGPVKNPVSLNYVFKLDTRIHDLEQRVKKLEFEVSVLTKTKSPSIKKAPEGVKIIRSRKEEQYSDPVSRALQSTDPKGREVMTRSRYEIEKRHHGGGRYVEHEEPKKGL